MVTPWFALKKPEQLLLPWFPWCRPPLQACEVFPLCLVSPNLSIRTFFPFGQKNGAGGPRSTSREPAPSR